MELDYVMFSMKHIFEIGQVYCGCSRAKEHENLQIVDYDAQRLNALVKKVRVTSADINNVLAFQRALEKGDKEIDEVLNRAGEYRNDRM